jgi:ketosteroid isomerase-like protein
MSAHTNRREVLARMAGASMLGYAAASPTQAAAVPTSPRQAWAHRDGRIALHKQGAGPRTVPAATTLAIQDAFSRFGMAHDEVQFEVLRSLFTEDAVLEVADGSGTPFQVVKTRDAIVANFANVLGQQVDQRRHCITNVLIESLKGNLAQALAYGIVTVAADGLLLGATVYYSADLRREADGLWRFARFFIGMDYYAGKKPKV